MCRQGLPRQFATSVKTTSSTFASQGAFPSREAAAARDVLNAALRAPGWGVPAPSSSDTSSPAVPAPLGCADPWASPGVPAQAGPDWQSSASQPLPPPQGQLPARLPPKGRTNLGVQVSSHTGQGMRLRAGNQSNRTGGTLEEKAEAHTNLSFWSLSCWGSALQAAPRFLIQCTDRGMEARELSRNPLPPLFSHYYHLTIPQLSSGAKRHSREKQCFLSDPNWNVDIKSRKDASIYQPSPRSCCPSASLACRKVPSHPHHNSWNPPSAQPLWCWREALLHRAGAAAAPLRGAVPERGAILISA